MQFKRVESLLDKGDLTLFRNMSNGNMERPNLLDKILSIIQDESPYAKMIPDEVVLKLFRLAKEYFNSCWTAYLDYSIGSMNLVNMMKYATTTVYYTQLPNGIRVATKNEVNNGIMELIPQVTNIIDEETQKNVYMLLWTFTGWLRFYKKAGLEYTYKDNELVETDYQLITRAGIRLRSMIDWISVGGNYERLIASLKLARKANKYKYPNYASDEITPNESIKQAIYICQNGIRFGTSSDLQVEAKRILYNVDKKGYKLLPHDITLIRKVVYELQNAEPASTDSLENDLAKLISKIEDASESGLIDKGEFVFKIIGTVKRTKKCSDRQMEFLKMAEQSIDKKVIQNQVSKAVKEVEESQPEHDLEELFQISEALGSGLMEGT